MVAEAAVAFGQEHQELVGQVLVATGVLLRLAQPRHLLTAVQVEAVRVAPTMAVTGHLVL
jgi:hypothetical protein